MANREFLMQRFVTLDVRNVDPKYAALGVVVPLLFYHFYRSSFFEVLLLWGFLGVISAFLLLKINLALDQYLVSLLPKNDPMMMTRSRSKIRLVSTAAPAAGCQICGSLQCQRHRKTQDRSASHPWESIIIPSPIDEALNELIERLLTEYARPWYSQITDNETFLDQIKMHVRFILATSIQRFQRFNPSKFILTKATEAFRNHLVAYLHAKETATSPEEIDQIMLSQFKHGGHLAMRSRDVERRYLRRLLDHLLPHMLSPEAYSSFTLRPLLRESLLTYVLEPLIGLTVDADFLTRQLETMFSPDTMPYRVMAGPVSDVVLLSRLQFKANARSIFNTTLGSILEAPQSLKAFMDFMKRENAINHLMFILDVQAFRNDSCCAAPNYASLKKEAKRIHAVFVDTEGGTIKFEPDITAAITRVLETGADDEVFDLCLFERAYDIIRRQLEENFCVEFLSSSDYFTLICGERPAHLVKNHLLSKNPPSRKNSPRLKRKKHLLTEAEIEKLNLPPPPSAIDDEGMTHHTGPTSSNSGSPSQASSPLLEKKRTHTKTHLSFSETLVPEDSDDESLEGDEVPVLATSPTHVDLSSSPSQSDLTMAKEPVDLRGLNARIKGADIHSTPGSSDRFVVYCIEVVSTGGYDGSGAPTKTRYLASSQGNVWVVERRFSDFAAMNKKLMSLYPDYSVEFPEKKSFGNFDPKLIDARKTALNAYLKGLLQNQLMYADPRCAAILYWFLRPGDEFKQFVKEGVSVSKVLSYVPPVWAARRIFDRTNHNQNMESFLKSFVVTQKALDEAKKILCSRTQPTIVPEKVVESDDVISNSSSSSTSTSKVFVESRVPLPFDHHSCFDNVSYLTTQVFAKNPRAGLLLPLLSTANYFGKAAVDTFLHDFLTHKLGWLLSEDEMYYHIKLIHFSLFDDNSPPRSDIEKQQTFDMALKYLRDRVPEAVQNMIGKGHFDDYTFSLIELFQSSTRNRLLLYAILDAWLLEFYPEIVEDLRSTAS